jgi:hypothetical protein
VILEHDVSKRIEDGRVTQVRNLLSLQTDDDLLYFGTHFACWRVVVRILMFGSLSLLNEAGQNVRSGARVSYQVKF